MAGEMGVGERVRVRRRRDGRWVGCIFRWSNQGGGGGGEVGWREGGRWDLYIYFRSHIALVNIVALDALKNFSPFLDNNQRSLHVCMAEKPHVCFRSPQPHIAHMESMWGVSAMARF